MLRRLPMQKLFYGVLTLTLLLFGLVLSGIVLYQRHYAPWQYHLTAEYPAERWGKFLAQRTGTSSLWKEGSFPQLIGAYPYGAEGTIIYKFAYPFKLGTVRIEDQHSQWGEGDVVRLWTSVDGLTWSLQYEGKERDAVVKYVNTVELASADARQLYVKYDFLAGDPKRRADDNRGATLREFHLQALPKQKILLTVWNLLCFGILPFSVGLTLLTGFLSLPVSFSERLGLAVLFCVILAPRLLGMFTIDQAPVAGDALDYAMKGRTLISFFTNHGEALTAPQGYAAIFQSISEKGILYPLFLALTYLLYGELNYQAVQMIQAVIAGLTGVLLYFIGKTLFTRTAGWVAGLLYAGYLMLITAAGATLQETWTLGWFCFAILLCLAGVQKDSPRRDLAAAGIVLGLTILSRYALNLLMLPFLLALPLSLWRQGYRRGALWSRFGVFAAGLAATLGLWLGLVFSVTGTMQLTTQMRPYQGIYKGIVAQGQQVDHIHVAQDSILEQVLQKQNHRYPTYADLREAYIRTVLAAPRAALKVMLNNLYYYWKYPYNQSQTPVFGTLAGHAFYHQILIFLGIWGIGLSLRKWSKTMFLLLPIAYITMICMMVAVEIRQALLAFPFLMIFGGYTVEVVVQKVQAIRRQPQWAMHKNWGLSLGGAGILLVLSQKLTTPWLLKISHAQITPRVAYLSACASVLLFWVLLIVVTYYLTVKQTSLRPKFEGVAFCGGLFPVVIVSLIAGAHYFTTDEWREWSVRLADTKTVLQQMILLPEELPEITEAYVKIDMQSGAGHYYDLEVQVNGAVARRFEHGLQSDAEFAEYVNYGSYPPLRGITLEKFRQWYTIPLKAPLLTANRFLDIRLRLTKAAGPPHYVDIYGDYRGPFEADIPLPAMGFGSTGTSSFKYFVDDDYRLRLYGEVESLNRTSTTVSREALGDFRKFQRLSDKAILISRYFDGAMWINKDISNRPGIQAGNYRIRLLLKDAQGRYFVI